MALDKLTKIDSQTGIRTTADYTVSDLTVDTVTVKSGGIKMPVGMSTFQNVTVTGELTVEGTTTTLDTNLIGVDRVEVGTNSDSVVGVAVTQSGSADIVKLVGSGSTVVTVTTGGNVLVGTTNEGTVAQLLTLYRSGTSSLELRTNTTGNSTIHFSDGNPPSGNAAYRGFITYDHRNDLMKFGTSASEAFYINASGQVGIGTTNPQAKFHILAANPVIRLTDSDQATDNKSWNIAAGTTNILRFQAIDDSGIGGGNLFEFYRSGTAINQFRGVKSALPWFVIDNNTRRVGIGTTIPVGKLDVAGKLLAGDSITHANLSNTLDTSVNAGETAFRPINLIDTSSVIKLARVHDSYGPGLDLLEWNANISTLRGRALISVDQGNLKIMLRDGGTTSDKVHITSAGNVGIGTTLPTRKLHVFGDGDTKSIVAAVAGDALFDLSNTGNGNYSGINFTRERSSGSVTGGSIFMPSVTANNSALLYLQVQTASAQSGVDSALVDNNGVRLKLASQPGGVAADSAFSVEVGASERLRITSTGNVGIGSASPTSVLDIVAADPVLTLRDTSATVTNANATLRLAESDGNGVIENYWDVVADNTVSNFGFAIKQILGGTTSTRFAIHPGTGKVGIGTDDPDAKLHVHTAPGYGSIAIFGSNDSTSGEQYEALEINNGVATYPALTNQASGDTLDLRSLGSVQVTLDANNNDNNTKYFRVSANGIGNTATELFRIHEDGKVLVDHNASVGSGKLQVFTKTADALDILSFDDTAADGGRLTFYRNRNTTYGSNTKLADDDSLGRIDFRGMNTEGTDNYEIGASIQAFVDGEPGSGSDANDMPGRLMFFTTPDGSDNPQERLRIDSTGKVGINTDAPESFASVQIQNHDTHNAAQILIRGDDLVQVIMRDDTGGTNTKCTTIRNDQGNLIFGHHNDAYGSFANRLYIASNGKVGVNVNPTAYPGIFVVSGDALICDRDIHSRVASGIGNSDRGFKQDIDGTEKLHLYADNSSDVILENNGGNERLRIKSNGNVGIGTDDPENNLHIMGGSAVVKVSSTTSATSARIILESEADSYGGVHFGDPDDGDSGRIRYYHGGSNPNHMSFTTNANERMRIDSSGRVLIGSSSETDRSISNDLTAVLQLSHATTPKMILVRDDTSIISGNHLGLIDFHSIDAGPVRCARIGALATSTHQTDDHATALIFQTTADNTSTCVERLRICHDGDISINKNDGSTSNNALLEINSHDVTTKYNNDNLTAYTFLIDTHFSGAGDLTANRTKAGMRLDMEYSGTGAKDNVSGSRSSLYGTHCTLNATKDTYSMYSGYFFAEAAADDQEESTTVMGIYGYGRNYSTGGSNRTSTIYGGYFLGYRGGDINSGHLYGLYGRAHMTTNGSGKSGDMTGIYAECEFDQEDVTTAYAFRGHMDRDAGTITNGYILYGSYSGDEHFTNRWGIYIGDSAKNYLGGDLTITGDLNANSGTKNFRIAHPLVGLSTTKDLVHAAIEGPQVDLIYRGKVDLVDGTATVNLDTKSGMTEGTFVALNRDVQCFTTNETGWTAVKGSVTGNKITIIAQDNSCTDNISWMVVGERQDDAVKQSNNTDADGKLILEPDRRTDLNDKYQAEEEKNEYNIDPNHNPGEE